MHPATDYTLGFCGYAFRETSPSNMFLDIMMPRCAGPHPGVAQLHGEKEQS